MATQKRPLPSKDLAQAETNRTIQEIFDNPYTDRAYEDLSIPADKIDTSGWTNLLAASDAQTIAGSLDSVVNTPASRKAANEKSFIHVDNYGGDIAAALAQASTDGVAIVKCAVDTEYTISSTLTIPAGVTLDLGAETVTTSGVNSAQLGATIRATAQLDPMISMGYESGIQGGFLNGGSGGPGTRALVGIQCDDVNYVRIKNMHINRLDGTAIKMGGVLFPHIEGCAIGPTLTGYGLDALASYSTLGLLYGINVGVSRMNEWKGDSGAIRLEGQLLSMSDDFEDGNVDAATAVIEIGDNVNSQMTLVHPYFELTSGTVDLTAIEVGNSCSVAIYGGQAFGDNDPNSTFLNCTAAANISVIGSVIRRFATGFSGTLSVISNINVSGNRIEDTTSTWGISTNLAQVQSALIMVDDYHYKEKSITFTDVGDFNSILASHHIYNSASPGTISNVGTIQEGHQFVITNEGTGDLTLQHGGIGGRFNMASGANAVLNQGESMSFVHVFNKAWEIGDASVRFTA